jgi:hypothetical protein
VFWLHGSSTEKDQVYFGVDVTYFPYWMSQVTGQMYERPRWNMTEHTRNNMPQADIKTLRKLAKAYTSMSRGLNIQYVPDTVQQAKDYTIEQGWGCVESFAMQLHRTRVHHRGSGCSPDYGYRLSRGLEEKAPITN